MSDKTVVDEYQVCFCRTCFVWDPKSGPAPLLVIEYLANLNVNVKLYSNMSPLEHKFTYLYFWRHVWAVEQLKLYTQLTSYNYYSENEGLDARTRIVTFVSFN